MNDTFAIGFSKIIPIDGPGYYSILFDEEFSRSHKEKNFYRTDLEVVLLPNGTINPNWPKDLFIFESNSKKQVLIIDLVGSPFNEENGTYLHHLDHITCDEGELVGTIYHQTSPVPSDPRHPLTSFQKGTRSIAIEFIMPPKVKTAPFKFSVYVRKTGTTELHDADPQVGNDPPAIIDPSLPGP